jgi:putative acetyltransferase
MVRQEETDRMKIRAFRHDDMEAVLDIWLRASIKAHDFIAQEFWEDSVEDMRNIYLPAAETHVAEHDGTISGFFSLHDNCLAAIFVAPEWQGRGVGRRLIEQAMTLRDRLTLNVYRENHRSIRFYEQSGFRTIAEQVDSRTSARELVMEYPGQS